MTLSLKNISKLFIGLLGATLMFLSTFTISAASHCTLSYL